MLRTNKDKLVMQSLLGEISHPTPGSGISYIVTHDGKPVVLPSVGGINYNVRIGDLIYDLAGDHTEPAVSIKYVGEEKSAKDFNAALNIYACIGNEVRVVSGEAKGEKGHVTGKHGGIEHVIVDFNREVMDKMVVGDKMQVIGLGTGLKLLDYPEIIVMNIDPNLLEKIEITELKDHCLEFPVTHEIPAKIMGSGLGAMQTYSGDYDIQLFDEAMVREYGLEDLRFGDFISIMDADSSYGRIYKPGAVTIGVIVHGTCVCSGHGPGVVTVMTSTKGKIIPKIQSDSNLQKYFSL
ncbi:MAG: DUF4438 domain-containing protein [Candidatus Neomarinimicrobiota bacterium]